MDPQNQYNSLPGDTSDLHLVMSEEKQYDLSMSLSGIINLQLTRTTHLLSRPVSQCVRRHLSSDDSDGTCGGDA